jgi:hypothetical protein
VESTRRARQAAEQAREEEIAAGEQLLTDLFASETPVERSAEVLVERFGRGPVPTGVGSLLAGTGSPERARAVADEVARRVPGSLCALTLAADVARFVNQATGQATEPEDQAADQLERARAAATDPKDRAELADHFRVAGRLAETFDLVLPWLAEVPADQSALEIYAAALCSAHDRAASAGVGRGGADGTPDACPCRSGRDWSDCCRPGEQAALRRFGDRQALYTLREAISSYVERSPSFAAAVHAWVGDWAAAVEKDSDTPFEDLDGFVDIATEYAWLRGNMGADAAHADKADWSPLRAFVCDPETPPGLAAAGRRWLDDARYGLWQVADPEPAPGIWLTDIVTGVQRYVAIPPEQLPEVSRWTVLLTQLIPDGGAWRTGPAVVPLRPSEADMLAALIHGGVIAEALAGEKRPQTGHARTQASGPRPGHQAPHGVIANYSDELPAEVARVYSRVIGTGLAHLVRTVLSWRNAAPAVANTDGDRMCFVTARLLVGDAVQVAEKLAKHPDIELDDGDRADFLWWGRPLTAMESATALAEARAQLADAGVSIDPGGHDRPQRWLRGRIRVVDGGLRLEVNSKERLARFLDLLRELGEEPSVADEARFDPALDLPVRRGRGFPFQTSDEALAAWLRHWPDEPARALGGRTPRRAAARPADRAMVESLLRELEHDADLLARRGMSAPDIAILRKELDMELDVELDMDLEP